MVDINAGCFACVISSHPQQPCDMLLLSSLLKDKGTEAMRSPGCRLASPERWWEQNSTQAP